MICAYGILLPPAIRLFYMTVFVGIHRLLHCLAPHHNPRILPSIVIHATLLFDASHVCSVDVRSLIMTLLTRIIVAAAACKVLLIPAYRSTDFEVHRNWLAITHSLPLNKWYTEATSEWTLDYPPFFGYFEWALSQMARVADAKMLHVHNLNYASPATVCFQRATVVGTELLLLLAATHSHAGEYVPTTLVRFMHSIIHNRQRGYKAAIVTALTAANAGLLIVDHIHFQYNGVLLGLLWCSVAAMSRGHDLVGAAVYTVLVHSKHLYAVAGPLYAVYLLRRCSLRSLACHAAVVVAISALSLAPFWSTLPALLGRLFPFHRGLLHAYWAPNAYALYAAADKVLGMADHRIGTTATLTGGLVGSAAMAMLPTPSSTTALLLTLAGMAPALVYVARRPHPVAFLDACSFAFLTAFMFGYHVHEKAILNVTVLSVAGALRSKVTAAEYVVLSTAGHVGLMPLLFTAAEYPIKVFLVAGHALGSIALLSCVVPGCVLPRHPISWYLSGFILLEVYKTCMHHHLLPHLPFLPLMLTSVYCALGVAGVWVVQFVRYVLMALAPHK